jgi:hypothetical protein
VSGSGERLASVSSTQAVHSCHIKYAGHGGDEDGETERKSRGEHGVETGRCDARRFAMRSRVQVVAGIRNSAALCLAGLAG